jgi:hypothetical protein
MDKQLEIPAKIIRRYIAFDGKDKTSTDHASEQSILQSKGTAALWQRLQGSHFAYLADEVGMGKTRQAMAVLATQILLKPDSRIVIICPGRPLQDQWVNEWNKFVSDCLLLEDGTLKSVINPNDTIKLTLHNRLKDFAKSLLLDEEKIHLLRYSSFSRPIGFRQQSEHTPTEIKNITNIYLSHLHEIGINALSDEEKSKINNVDTKDDNWRGYLTYNLNKSYAERFSILLEHNTRKIDLVICDEAQYLRHTGNARNTNINASIGKNKTKWLFLSATPLHNGPNDLKSLDKYICTHNTKKGKPCNNVECSQITANMEGIDRKKQDIVDVMKQFMVRRPRTYTDHKDHQYNKSNYRDYKLGKVLAANDAFASIVTALVQKRLVEALAGKNNRFRQGECSSFESLASSVGKRFYKNADDIVKKESEYEHNGSLRYGKDDEEAPDRSAIDLLNHSLQKALNKKIIIGKKDPKQIMMPHAKIYEVAEKLRLSCIKNAPNHKSLVFVRRLDTVDELMVTVQQLFQNEIDRRISLWASYFKKNTHNFSPTKEINVLVNFWSLKDTEEITGLDNKEDNEEESSAIKQAENLPYFQAISAKSKIQKNNGLLHSFLTRLLQNTDDSKSPLSFLAPYNPEQNQQDLKIQWQRLLTIIYRGEPPSWLLDDEHFAKTKILKRAMLQCMRRSDFLVDLYIMHNFLNIKTSSTLGDKLLYIFENARNNKLIKADNDLNIYFNNWLDRLQSWCDHFLLIYEKCFQSGSATNFEGALNSMNEKFLRMGPIAGRSGRMYNKHAVTQFKMPCYPNILVCTDILKEGVDMHLFCDEVIHYGVAWTSGDLEQRIGRVDRVKSLIHRKISTYEGLQRTAAPKLDVGFPYLGGTLDQHQVLRVIKDKKVSDLRMDFGKSEDEVKEITLESLQNDSSTGKSETTEFEAIDYYPLSIFDQKHHIEEIRFAYQNNKLHDQYEALNSKIKELHGEKLSISATILNEYGYVELSNTPKIDKDNTQKHQPNFDNLTIQWKFKKYRRKFVWVKSYQLITIINSAVTVIEELVELIDSNNYLEPQSIRQADCFPGFVFSRKWNTLCCRHTHEAPFQQTEGRSQTVILERLGNHILARSPVIHQDELGLDISKLKQWIGERNNERKFGYLSIDNNIIWLCFNISYPTKHDTHFNSITDKLSLTADRLQLLFSAKDNEDWGYLSPPSFTSLIPKNSGSFNIHKNIIQNKDFAKELIKWLEFVFRSTVRSIYKEANEITTVENIISRCQAKIKKNGLIYIEMPRNTGVRFRLSAYLDFTPNKDKNTITLTPPRLIWQLIASTTAPGPIPKYEFYKWNEIPHNDPDIDYWANKVANNFSLHTYKVDNIRCLILYHKPGNIDGKLTKFLNIWAKVLPMIKDGNLQKTHIFNQFELLDHYNIF